MKDYRDMSENFVLENWCSVIMWLIVSRGDLNDSILFSARYRAIKLYMKTSEYLRGSRGSGQLTAFSKL